MEENNSKQPNFVKVERVPEANTQNKKEKNDKKSNSGDYKKVSKAQAPSSPKAKGSFGKSVVIPFFSGIIGATLAVGICFGVPNIKSKLVGESNFNPLQYVETFSKNTSSGIVDEVSLSSYSDTAVGVSSKLLPSIVGIKVQYTVDSGFSFFGRPSSSTAEAEGSGVIISQDGYILTNNHVVSVADSSSYYQVSEANKITVTLYNDKTEYEAKIIGTDEQTDLAVIKIEKENLNAATLGNSDAVKIGEMVFAIGNPLGMQSSVTSGIISAVNREVQDSDGKTFTLIQTDAAINSGNSGGALVNASGEVIGINTLKIQATGVEGMGFAIPINSTKSITDQLISHGKVKRPYIGISGRDVNEETSKRANVPVGIYIASIEEFSAAEKAGLKVGDVIVEADGKEVKTMDELNEIKNKHSIGDTLTLKIKRDNTEKQISLVLQEQP